MNHFSGTPSSDTDHVAPGGAGTFSDRPVLENLDFGILSATFSKNTNVFEISNEISQISNENFQISKKLPVFVFQNQFSP